MSILTPQEKSFLDVFLHEATTSPFTGPATASLHKIGVEYRDISYIAWAYEQDPATRKFLTSAGWAPDGARRALDVDDLLVPQLRLHTSIEQVVEPDGEPRPVDD